MKTIHYHRTEDEVVNYCHPEEIPEGLKYDFKDWMQDMNYDGLVVVGLDHMVYRLSHVREYLNMKGLRCNEIIEDEGHLVRDILRGKSKLEIMD